MKKKDLVVGKEYLSNGRQDWNTSIYNADRVKIVSLETGSWKWQNGILVPTTLSSSMKGLRVRVLDKKTGEEKGEAVVTLASLRGEWEPTFAAIQKNHNDRIQAQEAAYARRNAARDKVGILMAKVKSFLGLTSDYETSKYVADIYKENKVMISADFLDAMITELDKQGWKYQP
jgi:hypothetical protein